MRLHLGCGHRFIPGFTHVDAVPHPHVDLVHSVDVLPMVPDGAADLVYACHVLEHFHRREVSRVLGEWFRVLRPGGTLRLSVPDFDALAEVYDRTSDLNLIIGPLFGRGDYLYNIHHTVFDHVTLAAALAAAGFASPCRYDWRQTEHADVDDYSQAYLPHLDRDGGILISLNMEATKP